MPPLGEKNVKGVQWHDKIKFLFARVDSTCSLKATDVLLRATFIKNKVFLYFFIKLSYFSYDQIITTIKTLWDLTNTYEAML